jgi:hypothetical protein
LSVIAFTICANNYLAHAQTLAKSFKEYHPETNFFVAILDEPNEIIDYKALGADQIIWVHELFPELVNELKDTYSIAELSTVVKPKLFNYFFEENFKSVFYIDPDIKVFSRFNEVLRILGNHDVVLTPHICSPTGDQGHPQDKDLMRTGIYNLGFLAMNKSTQTISFIEWWDKRVRAYGYHDLKNGFFYDQIWLGYAPAFLDKVCILRHLGYNIANWNLHEREIINSNEQYFVNDLETPVAFFHFSHFKMENLPELASYNQNYNLENRPDLKKIYSEYKSDLIKNGYKKLNEIDYKFGKRKKEKGPKTPKIQQVNRFKRAKNLLKKAVKTLIYG